MRSHYDILTEAAGRSLTAPANAFITVRTLHLIERAPPEVAKAAYKALARLQVLVQT